MEEKPATKIEGTNPKLVSGENRPKLLEFYSSKEFSDMKIKVNKKEYQGHRIILASSSEVFKTMMSSDWNAGSVQEIRLEESPLTEEVFEEFIEFMYNWKITFTEENVIPLLLLADKYMVSDLIKIAIDYMIEAVNRENVIPWYKFSLQFKINPLYNKCITYISHNFEDYVASKQLLGLEVDELTPILNSGSVITTSEMKLITLIINWVQYYDRADSDTILKDMERLLMLVRYPMMSPAEMDIVEKIPALREVLPKILHLLYRGYKFHTLGYEYLLNRLGANKSESHYFLPRIYTDHFGIEIGPSVPTRSFYTPAHLSSNLNVVNSIRWTYTKNTDFLQVSFPIAAPTQFSARFVVMTKREVDGKMDVIVLTDKIVVLSLDVQRVFMGFCSYTNVDVQKNGLTITILPKIL